MFPLDYIIRNSDIFLGRVASAKGGEKEDGDKGLLVCGFHHRPAGFRCCSVFFLSFFPRALTKIFHGAEERRVPHAPSGQEETADLVKYSSFFSSRTIPLSYFCSMFECMNLCVDRRTNTIPCLQKKTSKLVGFLFYRIKIDWRKRNLPHAP